MNINILIEDLNENNLSVWITLREQLWPHHTKEAHQADGESIISSRNLVSFIALDEEGNGLGFADASIRHDYVNGCNSSPVVFLEGIFVSPTYRKCGIAKILVDEVQSWGIKKGCKELASDTGLDNVVSQKAHIGLGFQMTEKVVFFKKELN
ncbi:aminoglycoside 6'-N-acetyltransferase [Xenorhabdus vietnamensis]|uniref:Aminoglycoside N(6')-acetyltransferase type 1 n=1 Tax=Xenorhabdus vietnamensis TaxID=351656 RepID=A0A1Y2SK61_9GAMM|nr:aminoglycoside 6'-N-acetyltransferase [Xenorhabdus vietnamensis]OTA17941.1 aminoglycoside 6'-N-acetyltransferase [Xenorhabdus vietnamensis]